MQVCCDTALSNSMIRYSLVICRVKMVSPVSAERTEHPESKEWLEEMAYLDLEGPLEMQE